MIANVELLGNSRFSTGIGMAGKNRLAGLAQLCVELSVGGLLFGEGRLEKFLGQQGLTILTKLTGLFVSAISEQISLPDLRTFSARSLSDYAGRSEN